MTNKTVLSDEARQEIKHRYFQGIANNTPVCLMELTEQALLQSPEIQQLRKDAERYRWLRDSCGIVEYKQAFGSVGAGMLPSGEALDQAIDNTIKALGYAKTLAAENEDPDHELQLH